MENHESEDQRSIPVLTIGVEERLPPLRNVLYGLQHVFVSNVWLDPIFVAAMIGLPVALAANMVNAIFIAAGLVTLTQATRLARLPIVQGPSAAFDTLMINAGKANSLPAAGGSIMLSAAIVFLLAVTGVLERLRSLFTKAVTGSVIIAVGIALSGFTLYEFLGGSQGMSTFLAPQILAISIPTALVVTILSLFGKGNFRTYAFLIALVIGDIIAAALGQIHFSVIAEKAWFGFPRLLPYGALTLNGTAFVTFFIGYIVAVIEALGVYHAASEMAEINLDARRIRNGFAGEAAGSMISTLIGGFPTTAYAQNVGLLRLTGVGSRFTVMTAGAIFLVLGFIPKAGALLAVTPDAVVGGIFLPAAVSLIYTGLSTLNTMEKTEANYMIAGFSILLSVSLPSAVKGMTGHLGDFLSNGIMIGASTAIILQIILVMIPGWLRKRG
ncbi:solute carrier family 23 protein [Desulfosporosinus sp. FKB]|uniref:solute carrier family 23 protein n=1 Tax=Desulfosporosinus sp. FKB TaxID=1969835 RepID=UPI001A9A686F|nr:solute carrier family 23 protein [Desulfosporosinus sp. FKB]